MQSGTSLSSAYVIRMHVVRHACMMHLAPAFRLHVASCTHVASSTYIIQIAQILASSSIAYAADSCLSRLYILMSGTDQC